MSPPFNFLSCVDVWDAFPGLRRRARSNLQLVQDSKGRKIVPASLANIALNAEIIRPLTRTMAKHGLICTKSTLLRDAVWEFYRRQMSMEREDDQSNMVTAKQPKIVKARLSSSVAKTVKTMKKILTIVRRKWVRWEMPRVPSLKVFSF